MNRIIVFLVMIACSARAQNDFQISHFMFNEMMMNPAATGNTDKFIASLLARKQWIGMDRSPGTQFFNAHAYVDPVKGGVGLTIINDQVGYESILNMKLSYAYHLKISEKSSLSVGVSGGFMNKRLDGTKLIYEESYDPGAVRANTNLYIPDFGAGIEYNCKNFTTGISSTHISQNMSDATLYKIPRHYFYYAKYKFEKDDITITPALLVKSALFITHFDLNTNVMYKNVFWGGLTYRYKESIVGMVGFQVNKVRIGYSYDFNSAPLRRQSSGSHEIMLQAVLNGFAKKEQAYKSPRFF
jgi:type IX secretion system PorP/SprF family membrane protein